MSVCFMFVTLAVAACRVIVKFDLGPMFECFCADKCVIGHKVPMYGYMVN